MVGQLTTIWKFRHFWMSLVAMDLRTRYRRSILGIGWSLMNPIMMTIVFCVVFSRLFATEQLARKRSVLSRGHHLVRLHPRLRAGRLPDVFPQRILHPPMPVAACDLYATNRPGRRHPFLDRLAVVIVLVLVLQPAKACLLLQIVMDFGPRIDSAISVRLVDFDPVQFHDGLFPRHAAVARSDLSGLLFPDAHHVSGAQLLIDHGAGILLLKLNPVVTFFELTRTPILDDRRALRRHMRWSKAAIVVDDVRHAWQSA